jgi:hypothetical protein
VFPALLVVILCVSSSQLSSHGDSVAEEALHLLLCLKQRGSGSETWLGLLGKPSTLPYNSLGHLIPPSVRKARKISIQQKPPGESL